MKNWPFAEEIRFWESYSWPCYVYSSFLAWGGEKPNRGHDAFQWKNHCACSSDSGSCVSDRGRCINVKRRRVHPDIWPFVWVPCARSLKFPGLSFRDKRCHVYIQNIHQELFPQTQCNIQDYPQVKTIVTSHYFSIVRITCWIHYKF